jgi:hypothetical protein
LNVSKHAETARAARKAVKRKKVTRKKQLVAKKKSERWHRQVKPNEKAVEPTETATP